MLILVVSGCGSATRCYPTSGTVMVQQQPAAGAVVILHPRNANEQLAKLRPYGTVDSSGKFTLNCMEPGDGAPPGEYAVTITWEVADPALAKPDSDDPEATVTVPDRLGGKYKDPKTSGLTATIKAGTNEIPAFSL
jgi:hypothetical protein